MLKKFLLFLFLLWPSFAFAQPFTAAGNQIFTCALVNIAATLTQCQAVPLAGSGLRYYITDIAVQSTTATSGGYSIQSGTGTNCATSTTAVFPSSGTGDKFNQPPTTAAMAHLKFTTPLAITAGHAICLLGVATNTTSIQIIGYSGP